MSVYTEVRHDDLVAFLDEYDVGVLVSYQGISEGIENTNYFVTTARGEFVLTLFEQHEFSELGYFLDVMTFFYQHNIPSAHPQPDKQKRYLKTLCGRPAALVVRLSGRGVESVASLEQCQAIGDVLGRMHIVGQHFTGHRQSQRDQAWRQQTAASLRAKLDEEQSALLQEELSFQADYDQLNLPAGLTHSDLFRDNALFENNELKGIIDFYYACDEYLLYDLAVAVNDWCIDSSGYLEQTRYQALMLSYIRQRSLTAHEVSHWNKVLRAAALRFWLSRLQDMHFPREGELTQIKDPDAFLTILKQHRDQPLIVAAA